MYKHKHHRRNTDESVTELRQIHREEKMQGLNKRGLTTNLKRMKQRLYYGKQKQAGLHPRAKEVSNYILRNHGILKKPQAGAFLTTEGQFIGGKDTHYETVRELANRVEVKIGKPDSAFGEGSADYVDDSHIHEFLQKTNLVRVQNFPHIQKTTLHVASPLTNQQIKKIQDIEKDDPNSILGFAVGSDYETLDIGEGFRDFMSTYRKHFGIKSSKLYKDFQKLANLEYPEEFNTLYQKSKKIKILKKKPIKEKMAQFFAQKVSFDEVKKRFESLKPDFKQGFTYSPRLNKLFNAFDKPQAIEMHKEFGVKDKPLYIVATTSNIKGIDALKEQYESISDRDVFLGGFHSDERNEDQLDISFPTSDENEALQTLEKYNQESGLTISPTGEVGFMKNPKFKKVWGVRKTCL